MQLEPGCDLHKRLTEHDDAGQNAEQANDDPLDERAHCSDRVHETDAVFERVDFIVAEIGEKRLCFRRQIVEIHFEPHPQSAFPAALCSLI